MTDNFDESATGIAAEPEMGSERRDAGGTTDDLGISVTDADVETLLAAEPIDKLCQDVKGGGISLGALETAEKKHKVQKGKNKKTFTTKFCFSPIVVTFGCYVLFQIASWQGHLHQS